MSLSSLSSLSDKEEKIYRRRRQIPDREDLFSKYDGDEFRTRFRVSKEAAVQIERLLSLHPLTRRNKPIDGITQLLICLSYLATGSFQQVLADLVNIHKSTVCRIFQRVTHKLAELASIYIKMPEDDELERVSESFYKVHGFPNVIGAVDCTQVKIISRGGVISEMYRCRQGYFSINVQVVCDSELKIRDLIARWPGSIYDYTILDNSSLCDDFESGKYGNYLLVGDNGYYNKDYLMTPFEHPASNAEKEFNRSQIATHNAIVTCLNVWKRRCPCLERGVTLKKTSTLLEVIVACAVLHNMCIELNEAEPPYDFEPSCDQNYHVSRSNEEELSMRNAIVNTIFS